jgi:hypothetical protein
MHGRKNIKLYKKKFKISRHDNAAGGGELKCDLLYYFLVLKE